LATNDPKIYREYLVDTASRQIYEASFQLKGLSEEAALARAMIGNQLKGLNETQAIIDKLRSEISMRGSEGVESVKEKLRLVIEAGRAIGEMGKIQDRLNQTLDLVGRLVERDQKIRESMKLVVDVRIALLLLQHMTNIVNSICRDCDKRESICYELEHMDLLKEVSSYEIVGEEKNES
jgi:hypothetical protein